MIAWHKTYLERGLVNLPQLELKSREDVSIIQNCRNAALGIVPGMFMLSHSVILVLLKHIYCFVDRVNNL